MTWYGGSTCSTIKIWCIFSVVNGFKINMVKPIILEAGSIMKPTINDKRKLQLYTNLKWSKYWHGSLLDCHTFKCGVIKWVCRNFRGDFWAVQPTYIHLHPLTTYFTSGERLGLCRTLVLFSAWPRPRRPSNNPKDSFQHQGTSPGNAMAFSPCPGWDGVSTLVAPTEPPKSSCLHTLW